MKDVGFGESIERQESFYHGTKVTYGQIESFYDAMDRSYWHQYAIDLESGLFDKDIDIILKSK